MTLSKAIRKLEEGGLLRRESSEIDTRAMEVRFTAAGRTLVRKAIVAVEQADDAFFSCLSPRELQAWKTHVATIIAGSRK